MQNQKSIKTLTIVLIIVGITTMIFTASMIVLFCKFQSIPDTLCERFFTCVVGELGITGAIQVVKTIVSKKQCESVEDAECIDENISDDINNLEI